MQFLCFLIERITLNIFISTSKRGTMFNHKNTKKMNTNEIATRADVNALQIELKQLRQILESNLMATNNKAFLSGKEVKELLGISEGTLKTYRAKKWLPATKIGGKYYYRYEGVNAMVNQQGK